jgi:hypothetical protein
LQINAKLEAFAALAGDVNNLPAAGSHTVHDLD